MTNSVPRLSFAELGRASVAELFIRQARATPDAPAILDRGGTTTYTELVAQMRSIHNVLEQRRLASEQPVGVLMTRSAAMVATLLAVMHAGAAYVPLDPDDPAERNRRILEHSGCRLVLGDRVSIAALHATLDRPTAIAALDFVEIDRIEANGVAPELPPAAAGGGTLAYILFTSGSSGAPKGVEIAHENVVNLLLAARDLLEFSATDRYLAASTIGFDISVAELFLPLISGGSLLLRDRSIWLKPRQLADDIRAFGVTVVQMGPSVWAVALDEVPDFPRVRVAISTGEPVPPPLARRIAASGEQAWNLYGPTETTVWSMAHRLYPAAVNGKAAQAISAPIGRPVANTTVAILDEAGNAVRPGERGELYLGGAGVARGYRGNDALTAERFVGLGSNGERFYRTGDVVAWNEAGELEYFGRNDDQLKIRGVRIEPREVESAILEHPAVAQAAATWFAGAGSPSIVAAIVIRPGFSLTPAELRGWLGQRLPASMIPSRFVFPLALPLAPSGKVDRNAIRQIASIADDDVEWMATKDSWSAMERLLAVIWQRLLKRKTVGLDDHFFAVGGDSLAAVKMITEVESLFKISLPVQTAFEAPTLRRLAARVEKAGSLSRDSYGSNYLFPLVEVPFSRPLFFCNVDLRLAVRETWKAPCSLYSISHWAQGSGFIKAESVEELARSHCERIQAIQPQGPYRIAGFSFGGLLAFEIAQQLQQKGETVELLFLLDPLMPYRTFRFPDGIAMHWEPTPLDETWRGRISRHARTVWSQPRCVGPYVWKRVLWHARSNPMKQWLLFQLVHLHGHRPNPVSKLLVPRNQWPIFWYHQRRMAVRYVAQPYSGPVMAVFSARDTRYEMWRHLIPSDADVHFVPASHMAIYEQPALGQWLEPLEKHLGRQTASDATR